MKFDLLASDAAGKGVSPDVPDVNVHACARFPSGSMVLPLIVMDAMIPVEQGIVSSASPQTQLYNLENKTKIWLPRLGDNLRCTHEDLFNYTSQSLSVPQHGLLGYPFSSILALS